MPHFLQQLEVQIRKSKFGLVLVLRSSKQAGSLKVGFRLDPEDRLRKTARKIEHLHRRFHAAPIFGVDYALQDKVLRQCNEY